MKGLHGEPDEVYPMAQIVKFEVSPVEPLARVIVHYGNAVGGKWVSGRTEPHVLVFRDTPARSGVEINPETNQPEAVEIAPAVTDFTDLSAALLIQAGDDGKRYYDCLGRDLFLWLIEKGYYSGTVI